MMRVLHFLPVYAPAWQFGGPVLSVSRLCEGLVKQGVKVRVLTTNAGLPNLPSDQLGIPQDINGVEVIYYPIDREAGTIWSHQLVEGLPHHLNWAELLHLSSIWQPLGLPVQKAAHAAGVPVIQTLRGALGPYSWRRGWLKKIPYYILKEKPLLQKASALHCTTEQEAFEIKWLGLKSPCHILANPLDLSRLYCDPHQGELFRKALRIPSDQFLFVVAGRLHHKKGLDLLPKALQRIKNKRWHLVVIGDDDDGTGLSFSRVLSKYNLSQRCHWISSMPSSELIGPLNASDCLLLPSRHENFGNIVVEALACGSAVILSDQVGLSHVLSGCPGVCCAPRDVTTWSKLLDDAISSPRPGKYSEQWVKTRFNQAHIAQQSLNLYRKVLLDAN